MELEYDIRRTIILGSYMDHWGMPNVRKVMAKDSKRVELYSFPPSSKANNVHRFATVGLSSCTFADGRSCDAEIFLTVPEVVAQDQFDEITNYLFDVLAYVIEKLGRSPRSEDTVPVTQLAPKGWPKALLFDDPRGEPESLEVFHVGAQHVNLLWLIPIFGSEYSLIKQNGIEAFDREADKMEFSVVEVRRTPCA
ncbi:MAG: suppressor of fused domain protein [Pseudomonadales bacterium]|nr:suppressor of fused domain protein [Pseudomonadales bacterium]